MSNKENKKLVRRYYEEVVSTGAVDEVARFVSSDYVEVHDNKRYTLGLEGAKGTFEVSGRHTQTCASPWSSRLLRGNGL